MYRCYSAPANYRVVHLVIFFMRKQCLNQMLFIWKWISFICDLGTQSFKKSRRKWEFFPISHSKMQNIRQIKIQILNTKKSLKDSKLNDWECWSVDVYLSSIFWEPQLSLLWISQYCLAGCCLPAGHKFRWKFIHNLEKAILKWWALWKGTSGKNVFLKTERRAQFEANLVSPGSVRNCCMLNSVCSYISPVKDVHRLVRPPHYWHQHFVSRTPLLPRDFPQNDPTGQTV